MKIIQQCGPPPVYLKYYHFYCWRKRRGSINDQLQLQRFSGPWKFEDTDQSPPPPLVYSLYHRAVQEEHLPHPPHGTACFTPEECFIYLSFMEIRWIVKHCYGVTLTTFNQMRSNAKHFIEKYPNHSKPTVIKISLNNMRAGGDDQITSLQFLVIQLEQNQPIDHSGAQKKFLQ